MSKKLIYTIETKKGIINFFQEFITAKEYIEFLTRTELGKQYPKERFRERIETLVNNVQISIILRNEQNKIIGTCFGITDFAYWLFITDLGIDKEYTKMGLGKLLMKNARELAGGQKNICVFSYANENAVEFYKKIGMKESINMMELMDVEWTQFEVGPNNLS